MQPHPSEGLLRELLRHVKVTALEGERPEQPRVELRAEPLNIVRPVAPVHALETLHPTIGFRSQSENPADLCSSSLL
jgi:hypothetical protein